MSKPSAAADRFDVIILGTGIGGTLLATILAKKGVRVLLVEKGTHPRFTIGESTVPHFSLLMKILSDIYEIPELENLSYFHGVYNRVTTASGLKRHFGFVYHREGRKQNPREVTQLVLPDYPDGPESHLFRQDVDAYLFHVALSYGAVARQRVTVTWVDLGDSEVVVHTDGEQRFRGRYLVDATGHRSVIASQLQLREDPPRFQTTARSLFTHMIGVSPYDDCIEPRGGHGMPRRWSQGTLHHLFREGWMWVIPFNNHRGSRNPLCSVGVNFNLRWTPPTNGSPRAEFDAFLKRYPSIGRQFRNAVAVRDWVQTGRLQYSSKASVGDRFCLLAHAAGFIDALFSRGLPNTADTIYALAPTILRALEDGDFSRQRFEHVETLQQSLLDYNDRLVHCSYIAFSAFELWNAWYRIWILGTFLGSLLMFRTADEFFRRRDPAVYEILDRRPYPGSLCPDLDGYEQLFCAAAAEVEAVEAGTQEAGEAARKILDLLAHADFVPPAFRLADAATHCVNFNLINLSKTYLWGCFRAPPEVRRLIDFTPSLFVDSTLRYLKLRRRDQLY